mgnify:CR=1 FL=1
MIMAARSTLKRFYIATMMAIVGRGLAIASRIDAESRREATRFPQGSIIALRVHPRGPACVLQRSEAGLHYLGGDSTHAADVEIIFKHLQHAWLLFTFQENTPTAFARNRLVLDGEVAHGAVFNRSLARLLVLILPRFIARRALKRYPDIGGGERFRGASAIYLRLPLEKRRSSV